MTRDVITFSVQMGSGGQAIAREVARRLSLRYYDREVISQAAALIGVPDETVAAAERWPRFIERLMERLVTTSVASDGLFLVPVTEPSLTMHSSASYRALIEEVVRKLADEGDCVIVGHAGQVILRDVPGVFKVLVHGSLAARAMTLASQDGLEPEDAVQLINDDDSRRSRFFKCAFGTEWLSSSMYDLTINGGEIDTATAASWVVNASRRQSSELVPA